MMPKPNWSYLANIFIVITLVALPWYDQLRFSLLAVPFTAPEVLAWLTIAIRFIAALVSRHQRLVVPSRLWLSLGLGWIALGLLAVFLAPDVRSALGIFKAYIVLPVFFSWIVFDQVKRQGFQLISAALGGIALQVSLLCLGQLMLGWPVFAEYELQQGRSSAMFNTANSVGLLIGPIALYLAGYLLQSDIQPKLKYIYGAILILSLVAMVTTGSEGALLALVVATLYLVVFSLIGRKWRIPSRWKIGLALVLVLGYLGANIAYISQYNNPPQVANPYTRPGFTTMTIRQCVWQGTWRAIQSKPVTGFGLAGFTEEYLRNYTCDAEPFTYPHNLILNFWSELGIAGLFVTLFIIWLTLGKSFGGPRRDPQAFLLVSLQAGMVYWLMHGLVDVPYFKNDLSIMWWLWLALIFSISSKSSYSPKPAGQ